MRPRHRQDVRINRQRIQLSEPKRCSEKPSHLSLPRHHRHPFRCRRTTLPADRFYGGRSRGRENIHKRYLIHVAGYNLGLIMRLLTGAGTPREFQARLSAGLVARIRPNGCPIFPLIDVAGDRTAAIDVSLQPDPLG
jgi:hypothetical protein